MCPWLPNTSADFEVRLATVRMLRQSHSNVAWALMLSMLPERHGVQHPSEMPRFRDWRPGQPAVTQREYAETPLQSQRCSLRMSVRILSAGPQ